jgi:hypothetical protein
MAEQGAIFESMRDALIEKIYATTQEDLAADKDAALWKHYETSKDRANPLEDVTGRTRLFRVGRFQRIPLTIGHTSRRFDVTGEIKIGYPMGDDYIVVANSDADKIARKLFDDPINVTGCDFIVVNENVELEIEIDTEEHWQWVTLPLVGVIETTA